LNSEQKELSIAEQQIMRIGVVATDYTWDDLASYKEIFNKIQTEFGDKVKFFLIGFEWHRPFFKKSCCRWIQV
jgi:hypothetical protein